MVFGCYDPAIDKKGRMAVPSKLREKLGETFMICRGIYGKRCLCIYPMADWEKLVESIEALSKTKSIDVKRFLYDGAFNVEFDTQGRILVPPTLREYANFDSEVHIIGMDTNLEIWDKDNWNEENKSNTLESISNVMEELNF